MRLYRYLSADHALDGVRKRRLKVSRIEDLNDPFELEAASYAARKVLATSVRDHKIGVSQASGVLCFSETWQNTLMWSHYADRHRGICLGFDVAESLCKKVMYEKSRVAPVLGKLRRDLRISGAFAADLLHTKFSEWSYEREWRAYVDFHGVVSEGDLYFRGFDDRLRLAEVYLGPRCDLSLPDLRSEIGDIYDYRVYVRATKLSVKKFSVVDARWRDRK